MSNLSHSFNVGLAVSLGGVESALVLQHFYFWMQYNEQNKDMNIEGRVWFYCSRAATRRVFPYISDWSIRSIIDKLIEGGYVIKGDFSEKLTNKSTWYTLTEKAISLLEGRNSPLEDSTNGLEDSTNDIDSNRDSKEETNINNVCKEDSLFGGGSLEEPIGKSDNHPQKEVANSLLASVEDKRKKREVLFRNECMGFAGEFGREMVERFIEYWTEPTPNRAKMRFELERTWDTHRRMLTWSRKSYNQPSVQAEPQRKPMSVDEALRRAYGKH